MSWKKICSIIFAICVSVAGFMAGGYFIGQAINPPPNVYEYEQEIVEKDNSIADLQSELQKQVDEWKKEKDGYISQVESLTSANATQKQQIEEMTQSLSEMTTNRDNLQNQVIENENTIISLNKQIADLDTQIAQLNNDKLVDKSQINTLKSQVENLQSLCEQLQKTNELNRSTISSLNEQIATLTKQLAQLNYETNNYSGTIDNLKARITELEKSIEYYEQYIAGQEVDDKVVATFEFNGSVYNIQILQKGSTASVSDPQSTDHVIFNYWTVDGDKVTLAEYPLTKNTVFEANITKKYDVKFMVDSQQHEQTQLVVENAYASKPTDPVKQGYDFDGWTLNGSDIVEISEQKIIGNTTFIAKFTKVHDVKFMYEDTIKETQHVRNGGYAINVTVDNTDHKIFNGWKLNGVIVNVSEQQIVADTTFVADITYKYDVKFMANGQQIGQTQIVENNGYASFPETPEIDHYKFNYWTINGNDEVNVATYAITQDTTFIANLTKLFDVKFMVDDQQFGETQIVEQNHYASLPEQEPSKDGFEFEYWTVNGNDQVNVVSYPIVSDTTFIAKFNDLPSFADASWSKISEISNQISINNMTSQQVFEKYGWKVGDEKTFNLTTGEEITVVILGFNHDDKTSGGKAGISIGMKNLLATTYKMNSTSTNVGGWDTSLMRTDTMKTLLSQLPADLQKVIKAVNKKASAGNRSTTITTSSDKLWLLSVAEISSKAGLTASSSINLKDNASTYGAEGEQYEYFKNAIGDADIYKLQTALVKNLSNGTGSAGSWWLRSPYVTFTANFWYISGTGVADSGTASFARGVSFNFCI